MGRSNHTKRRKNNRGYVAQSSELDGDDVEESLVAEVNEDDCMDVVVVESQSAPVKRKRSVRKTSTRPNYDENENDSENGRSKRFGDDNSNDDEDFVMDRNAKSKLPRQVGKAASPGGNMHASQKRSTVTSTIGKNVKSAGKSTARVTNK